MITEFFAQGLDVNLAYRRDGHIVKSQEDRAKFYETYALGALQIPQLVGIHWFAFQDGETSNWGIVDKSDKPYTIVLNTMRD